MRLLLAQRHTPERREGLCPHGCVLLCRHSPLLLTHPGAPISQPMHLSSHPSTLAPGFTLSKRVIHAKIVQAACLAQVDLLTVSYFVTPVFTGLISVRHKHSEIPSQSLCSVCWEYNPGVMWCGCSFVLLQVSVFRL